MLFAYTHTQRICHTAAVGFAHADKTLRVSVQLMAEQA